MVLRRNFCVVVGNQDAVIGIALCVNVTSAHHGRPISLVEHKVVGIVCIGLVAVDDHSNFGAIGRRRRDVERVIGLDGPAVLTLHCNVSHLNHAVP